MWLIYDSYCYPIIFRKYAWRYLARKSKRSNSRSHALDHLVSVVLLAVLARPEKMVIKDLQVQKVLVANKVCLVFKVHAVQKDHLVRWDLTDQREMLDCPSVVSLVWWAILDHVVHLDTDGMVETENVVNLVPEVVLVCMVHKDRLALLVYAIPLNVILNSLKMYVYLS